MRTSRALAAAVAAAFLAVLVPSAGQAAGGQGIAIAVLDTGVDQGHPEVAGRVTRMSFAQPVSPPVAPPVPLPGPVVGSFDDPDGQGTAVASIAAGARLGVAPNAPLFDLQVTGQRVSSAVDPATEQAAIDALDWLLRNHGGPGTPGVRVVLLSFAQGPVSDAGARTLAAQAAALYEAGVVVVVPANSGWSVLHRSPAVLTVAGVNDRGAATTSAAPATMAKPDLSANGNDVPAARAFSPQSPTRGETDISGSAAGAAQAAGAAALMLEARPDLPVDALYALLRARAADIGSPAFDHLTGFGRLDVVASVEGARTWADPLPAARPEEETPALAVALALAAVVGAVVVRRTR